MIDKASICLPICGDSLSVLKNECDDGNPFDFEGCISDCSGVMTGWKCDNVGDIEGEKPANCSVIGSLGKLTKFQEAVTYISFASTILTFVVSLSSGPGPFLLINAVALMRTFSVFNPKMDEELKKQLNNQLKEI